MDGIGHMTRVFGGGVSKEDAAHLNIQAHNVMDYVSGIRDYDDYISTGKFAAGTVQATGLDLWGQFGKNTRARRRSVRSRLPASSIANQGGSSAAGGAVASATFNPYIPASAQNTAITTTTDALPRSTSWGFQQ
jgi:hypothetical protein